MPKQATRPIQAIDFRTMLLTERERLLSGRKADLMVLNAIESLAIDDQAPLLHQQFVTLGQHRLEHRKLRLIDAALTRFDRGDFGVCEECGEPISPKRLHVIPWAAFCIACQDRVDKAQHSIDPDLPLPT